MAWPRSKPLLGIRNLSSVERQSPTNCAVTVVVVAFSRCQWTEQLTFLIRTRVLLSYLLQLTHILVSVSSSTLVMSLATGRSTVDAGSDGN
ncbi:hypothetical protein A0H81_13588 [Grifola frondosa]|uniref:Uncharacterized protein n=1 Tax=Grifola frondosa TaxID=5627 RepID=A0A1C7LNS9_GRIFR|nr:hypothetical protein A0H81_13588 [Grifola frondosa]